MRDAELKEKKISNESVKKIFALIRRDSEHNDFLSVKNAKEVDLILNLGQAVSLNVLDIVNACQSHSYIRTERIIPISLVVSGAAPFCSIDNLSYIVKVGLWLFNLDDFFDERLLTKKQLSSYIRDYRDILHGNLYDSKDNDQSKHILKELCHWIQDFKLYKPLRLYWNYSFDEIIDSMLQEQCWKLEDKKSHSNKYPTYEDYLELTRYSSGVPAYIWSMLISLDDDSIVANVPYLLQMEKLSSICIRLANDLQSDSREQMENKINSKTILENLLKSQGMTKELARINAKKMIKADISKRIKELNSMRSHIHTKTGLAEAMINDIALITCEFYHDFDFHTFNDLIVKAHHVDL